ncbi:MAG: hypothetical protein KBD53_09125 [Candidatus Omnitrophica bacterium]|nr:hypothetical protein [Candidatus Omnitrophota bacterium]
MKKRYLYLSVVPVIFFLTGCHTIKSKKDQVEYLHESQEALGSIAEAVTGKPLTEQEKKNLEKQLREDPEAIAAVESIANSVTKPPRLKYSPVTGKRYAGNLEIDPETGAKLLWLDED